METRTESPVVQCPVPRAEEFTPCDPAELEPLANALRADAQPRGMAVFPRGVLVEDGRLDLCKQCVGAEGMRVVSDALTKNTRVTSLLIGANGIGNEGATTLAGLLERNTRIESVYVGCNRIDAQGLEAIVSVLARQDTVRGLWLKRNPLGQAGAELLAKLLARTERLRTLDLVNTALTLEGVARLCGVLAEGNRSVERVYFGGNQMNAAQAIHLARVLRKNPALKALMLNVNALSDDGAAVLAEALGANSTLVELGLASNAIGPKGAEALARSVEKHPSLSRLDLGYCASTPILNGSRNHCGDEGARSIAEALRGNCVLAQLDLSHNGLTLRGVEMIVDALEANPATAMRRVLFGVPLTAAIIERLQRVYSRSFTTRREAEDATRADVRAVKSVYRS